MDYLTFSFLPGFPKGTIFFLKKETVCVYCILAENFQDLKYSKALF